MKTNLQTRELISDLKKAGQNVALWKRVAYELERPTRNLCNVNLFKLNKVLRDGEVALIPGKVLGTGNIDKKIEIADFAFSESALKKISAKGGKSYSLEELLKKNPKGSKVRIIK